MLLLLTSCRLPFVCSHCLACGDSTGCLVATASPVDFSRDVRDDYALGLLPVVQLRCLRAEVDGVAETSHWDVLLPERTPAAPRYFQIKRLFARLSEKPSPARAGPADDAPAPPTRCWWSEDICLNPAWTDVEPVSLQVLSRTAVAPHIAPSDLHAHAWTKMAAHLPAWAAALGVPCQMRHRATESWLHTLAAALSDPDPDPTGSPASPVLDWPRLRARYCSFSARVRPGDGVHPPHGPHLRAGLLYYRFGKAWISTLDRLLLRRSSSAAAATADGGGVADGDSDVDVNAWLRLAPADRPEWSCFLPRQSYWGSQIRLLTMQAFCDALYANTVGPPPSARPLLVLEPYIQTELDRASVLAMPDDDLSALAQPRLDHVRAQFADSEASTLFVLGYANVGRHWFAWQVWHKSRTVITYDGSVLWAAHSQVQKASLQS